MLFNLALVSAFLLASAALAGRLPEHRQPMSVERSTAGAYNSIYAGAALTADSINLVHGTFTVPQVNAQNGSVGFLVAIDGTTCNNVMLYAGVGAIIGDQGLYYNAIFQWYPDQGNTLDIEVSAGDQIQVTITAISTTEAWISIENLNTDKLKVESISSTTPLCLQDGAWFIVNGSQDPLPDFDIVNIVGYASGTGGDHGLQEATAFDIEENGNVETLTWITESSVAIKYMG